jgi:signal transduction histidine kinase
MDLINILLVVATGIMLFFGFSIFFHRSEGEKFAFTFFLLSITMASWSAAEILMRVTTGEEVLLYARINYAVAVFIPVFFLLFVLDFGRYKFWFAHKLLIQSLLYGVAVGLFFLTLLTNSIVVSVKPTFVTEHLLFFGAAYPVYILHYLLLFPFSYFLLLQMYRRADDVTRKNQIFVVLLGTFVNSVFGLSTDLIAPWFGENSVGWIANFTSIFFMASILYGMVQYRLFSLKIIATEIFAVAIWSILAVELFLTDSAFLFAVRIVIFFAVVLLSIFLIRSTYKEVEQRVKIEELYIELEIKNKKLTELDKLKSQFLSIATHELRTPLTIVRNFISLMLDGTYGKVNDALAEGGRQVFQRVDDMARSVDTYLNVSRIEQGKIKYDFAAANFSVLVETAYKGLLTNAEKKKLTLTLSVAKGAESIRMRLDAPKITEVLINLIDNSIKYTPKGSVHLSLERVGQRARFTISDTGVGMTEKTQQNLFKLFSPGEDSKRINPASTGVGLYVSKAHIEAHRGTLTATSAGPGKGSQFIVELPL